MSLVHYKPGNLFGQFDNEINRLFFNAHATDAANQAHFNAHATDAANQAQDWTPAVDIREEENRYVLEADIPGVASEDLDITLEDSVLTIKGERTINSEENSAGYRRRERTHGSFVRQFTLPDTVNTHRFTYRPVSQETGLLGDL